jgi:hypothetical protein
MTGSKKFSEELREFVQSQNKNEDEEAVLHIPLPEGESERPLFVMRRTNSECSTVSTEPMDDNNGLGQSNNQQQQLDSDMRDQPEVPKSDLKSTASQEANSKPKVIGSEPIETITPSTSDVPLKSQADNTVKLVNADSVVISTEAARTQSNRTSICSLPEELEVIDSYHCDESEPEICDDAYNPESNPSANFVPASGGMTLQLLNLQRALALDRINNPDQMRSIYSIGSMYPDLGDVHLSQHLDSLMRSDADLSYSETELLTPSEFVLLLALLHPTVTQLLFQID